MPSVDSPTAAQNAAIEPREQYRARLLRWQNAREHWTARSRRIGNTRLAVAIAGLIVAGIALGPGWISAWWLLLPAAIFSGLAFLHERADRSLSTAKRGIAYCEGALARLEARWAGSGNMGERFQDPKHVYADDLDLFGRGSLFELLSTARTASGERILAGWLLNPGEREQVLERQHAVAELRPRVDLREEVALAGDEVRAAVEHQSLKAWGERPPVHFFPGARVLSFALAAAAVVSFALFLAGLAPLAAFLVIILVELIFGYSLRSPVIQVTSSAAAPARDLRLLSALLARLEREPFTAPALKALHASIQADGQPASRQIQKLQGLMRQLESARNQFFMPIAAVLLWVPQFAMAIESWRRRCGGNIAQWMAAIGEFEALCSLAEFAYERPDSVFPELLDDAAPRFEAEGLVHPLIAPDRAAPNPVSLGFGPRLYIVSGSNMSGKSTLMRAVGLNTVLAWAGAPVTARQMRISRLYLGASLRANDSVLDNRSRFYAEISRLRDVVDLARSGKPTLFLLDELLSGTNSHDRRIGAEALIRGLMARGAIGMVTTHDLALAEIVPSFGGEAVNVHFEDQIEGNEIRFDYQLRPGAVTRGNGLALMRAVGLDV